MRILGEEKKKAMIESVIGWCLDWDCDWLLLRLGL